MKVFISQPMRGRSDKEILEERISVKSILIDKFKCDIEIIDSFFEDAPISNKPFWYLSKSLELMSTANLVYFVHGWNCARGCKIEHTYAVEYGIPIMYDFRS